jgi:hypothetical protein
MARVGLSGLESGHPSRRRTVGRGTLVPGKDSKFLPNTLILLTQLLRQNVHYPQPYPHAFAQNGNRTITRSSPKSPGEHNRARTSPAFAHGSMSRQRLTKERSRPSTRPARDVQLCPAEVGSGKVPGADSLGHLTAAKTRTHTRQRRRSSYQIRHRNACQGSPRGATEAPTD